MTDDDWTYRIGKLAPQPGEIVVIKAHRKLNVEGCERIRQTLMGVFEAAGCPDQPVLVLDSDFDLAVLNPCDFGPPPTVVLDGLSDEAKAELVRAREQAPPGKIQVLDRLDWRSPSDAEQFVRPDVMARFCAERGCEWRGCHEVDRSGLLDVTEPSDIYRVYMVSGSGGRLVTLGEPV